MNTPELNAWLARVATEPWATDFFALLRRIDAASHPRPRLGTSARPADDPVRLGQDPSLAFDAGTVAGIDLRGSDPRIAINFFGLLGPDGPLPLFLTEFARHRVLHRGDRTLVALLDTLQHRFITLFYRAWAQAQPAANYDRPEDDRFATYVGAFVGLAPDGAQGIDAIPQVARRHFAGLLARGPRNADGLEAILRAWFGVPVRLEQFAGDWLALDAGERTRLGARGPAARLGAGAVLGQRVWDRQSHFRLTIGPLSRAAYETFLPGGPAGRALTDWVRSYTGDELAWDVRLLLAPEDARGAVLGRSGQLGWTTWTGARERQAPAGDLVLNPERFGRQAARAATAQP